MPFPTAMNMDILRRVLLLSEVHLRRKILFMWRDIKDYCLELEAEQEALYHQAMDVEVAIGDGGWYDSR
jgi:hypothetical protein